MDERTPPASGLAARLRGRAWRLAVPVVVVVAGALFAITATVSHGTDLRAGGRQDLRDAVRAQQHDVAALEERLADLTGQVQQLTDAEAQFDSRVALAQKRADAVAQSAGMTALVGAGVTVSLDDAPPAADGSRPDVPPDYLVVHQQDVQAVVNALWAGGADAMMLMDQRIISTSAVRCVGNTLLLQGRVYSPPYTVTAIGDPAKLMAALDASRAVQIYRQYVDAFGLGYSAKTADSITAPAYSGSLAMRYAGVPTATAAPSMPEAARRR